MAKLYANSSVDNRHSHAVHFTTDRMNAYPTGLKTQSTPGLEGYASTDGARIPILYVEMDGTGIAVVGKESAGRAGKQDGQPAHTREAKLGCIFTETSVDDEGYPVRDEASTTYVGAIESCEEFGRRVYAEAWRRGWARAEKRVTLGDGAEWIWNQADLRFLGAIQIVDLYHARQPLWDLSAQLYPNVWPAQRRWVMVRKDRKTS